MSPKSENPNERSRRSSAQVSAGPCENAAPIAPYTVDAVLKRSEREITERVRDTAGNPFIRKRIKHDGDGFGGQYRAISGIANTALPRIYEVNEDDDEITVVMEYLEGFTLREWVDLYGPLSVPEAVNVLGKLLAGVDELHRCTPPLIHRDITPNNVVLSKSGVKLIDFGIARRFDENADHDTKAWGTIGYAAPEQFGFGQSDPRTDIYALGMLYYFCLTGKDPAPNLTRTIKYDHALSENSKGFIEVCIALEPDRRFHDVSALQNALQSEKDEAAPDPVSRVSAPQTAPDPVSRITAPQTPPDPASRIAAQHTPQSRYAKSAFASRVFPVPAACSPLKKNLLRTWRIIGTVFMVLMLAALTYSAFASWRTPYTNDLVWYGLCSLDIYLLFFLPLYLATTDFCGIVSRWHLSPPKKLAAALGAIFLCTILAGAFQAPLYQQFSPEYLSAAAQNNTKL